MIVLTLLLTFALSYGLTKQYISYAIQKNILDTPNHRSSHTTPTPRGGGVVFTILWMLIVFMLSIFHIVSWKISTALLPGCALLAIVGLLDDIYSLTAKQRIVIHLIAAVLVVALCHGLFYLSLGSVSYHLGIAESILAVFLITWSINLFNFMDGTDGIASIETLFVLLPYAFFLQQTNHLDLALTSITLALGVLGFLVLNFPPAKVFMGDVGSAFLGFVIISIPLIAQKQAGISISLCFILYGLFLFDSTITLIRRFFAKEKWYEAHRSHAYQRLHQAGWSHKKLLFGVIALNSTLTTLAVWGFYVPQIQVYLLITALLLLTIVYVFIERKKPMFAK